MKRPINFLLSSVLALAVTSCERNASLKGRDIVGQLCQHITKERKKMIVDTNQTETIWSDGAILEVGTNFPAALQELIASPTQLQDIHTFVGQLESRNPRDRREA